MNHDRNQSLKKGSPMKANISVSTGHPRMNAQNLDAIWASP